MCLGTIHWSFRLYAAEEFAALKSMRPAQLPCATLEGESIITVYAFVLFNVVNTPFEFVSFGVVLPPVPEPLLVTTLSAIPKVPFKAGRDPKSV